MCWIDSTLFVVGYRLTTLGSGVERRGGGLVSLIPNHENHRLLTTVQGSFHRKCQTTWFTDQVVLNQLQVKAIQEMGYTFLVSHHWGKPFFHHPASHDSLIVYMALGSRDELTRPYLEETLAQYRMFPDAVKVVLGAECLDRGECFKGEANPTGVPRWKSECKMYSFGATLFQYAGMSVCLWPLTG